MAGQWLGYVATLGFSLGTGCGTRQVSPLLEGPAPVVSAVAATPQVVPTTPPDPLYEQMTPSPGYLYVWIDGFWHWNGYEWVWVSGRWESRKVGQVYMQPRYEPSAQGFLYTPGHWALRDRIPSEAIVREDGDGRPAMVAAPPGTHPPSTGTTSVPPSR